MRSVPLKGIYLISDIETGKHYVGSAYHELQQKALAIADGDPMAAVLSRSGVLTCSTPSGLI